MLSDTLTIVWPTSVTRFTSAIQGPKHLPQTTLTSHYWLLTDGGPLAAGGCGTPQCTTSNTLLQHRSKRTIIADRKGKARRLMGDPKTAPPSCGWANDGGRIHNAKGHSITCSGNAPTQTACRRWLPADVPANIHSTCAHSCTATVNESESKTDSCMPREQRQQAAGAHVLSQARLVY
jgi:hypothetical protein